MAIQVVSQNVMCGQNSYGGQYEARRPLLKEVLCTADVMGLQEVTPFWKAAFDEDLPEYEYLLVYRGEKEFEATPIYWRRGRFEKRDAGHFWLSETPALESFGWGAAYLRICCWVRLYDKAEGREFVVVNTHLDNQSKEARVRGIEQIMAFIRDTFDPSLPLFLTGDLNAVPSSETIRTADRFLTDARRASGSMNFENTYHGFRTVDGACIDYIYVNSRVKCTAFEVVKEISGPSVQSDHYGLRLLADWA